MVVIGPRGGRHLARTYERMLVGEAVIERAHIDDDIRKRREVRQRLDADVIAVLGEIADARKLARPPYGDWPRRRRDARLGPHWGGTLVE
jgi:hypothetical protein